MLHYIEYVPLRPKAIHSCDTLWIDYPTSDTCHLTENRQVRLVGYPLLHPPILRHHCPHIRPCIHALAKASKSLKASVFESPSVTIAGESLGDNQCLTTTLAPSFAELR
jgi:hypothetical protein